MLEQRPCRASASPAPCRPRSAALRRRAPRSPSPAASAHHTASAADMSMSQRSGSPVRGLELQAVNVVEADRAPPHLQDHHRDDPAALARGRGGARGQLRDRRGRALRPARPERRRQDDDDQDADHAPDPDLGRGTRARARRGQGRALGARADRLRLRRRPRPLRAALGARQPPLLRRALRRRAEAAAAADRRAARARRPQGPREGARRGLLPRDAPAAPHRARPAPRPAGRLPRRADDRRRPGRRARAPRHDRVADGSPARPCS